MVFFGNMAVAGCRLIRMGYTADNDCLYPPHAAERVNDTFSWINYLNYQQRVPKTASRAKNEGAYYYLGSYLPEVEVYACPLGPAKPSVDLQNQYYDYKNPAYGSQVSLQGGTHVSYNLYWGGYTMSEIDFVGPTGKGSNKEANLLLSDSLNYWFDGGDGNGPQWWLSHKPKQGEILKQQYDPKFGNDCSIFWVWLSLPSQPPKDLKMNAGYTDGSVRRYFSHDTVMGKGRFWVPKNFR